MLIVFPFIGIILAAVTVWLLGLGGADIFICGLLYTLAYTIGAALCYVAFLLVLSFMVDIKKPNDKFDKFYNKIICWTLGVALDACNVKVSVEGIEKIPKGRFVLIQNHMAMFDPIVSLVYLGKFELGFITKPENMNLPVINKFMHRICCIPIDRENPRNAVKSINAACENIKNGVCSMAIYPEGTRARDGEMLPFHAGSFKIATRSGAPLVITTVTNTNKIHKNAPFKRTNVTLQICGVIPGEEVAASSTAELSERAHRIMCDSLGVEYSED